MKRYAPLLTLLAVAVLGGALFVLNVTNDPANRQAPAAAPTAAAPPANAGPTSTTIDLAQLGAPTATVDLSQVAAPTRTTIDLAELAAPETAYAGRSAGNEVTVAIAVKGGRAVAYICDGKKIEAWLEGTVTGKDITLKNADGTTTITGAVNDTASLGAVTVAGKTLPYSAKAVTAPAGLYEGRADVRGVAVRIGWIVRPDDANPATLTQTGVLGRKGGESAPAPALDPANPDGVLVDGVPVTVTTIDGGDTVILP